jgi:hypothetical protein
MISRSLAVQLMLEVTEPPDRLRKLAAWYRDFAEMAGNPVIWESRLLMAESLEKEAERVEHEFAVTRRRETCRSGMATPGNQRTIKSGRLGPKSRR